MVTLCKYKLLRVIKSETLANAFSEECQNEEFEKILVYCKNWRPQKTNATLDSWIAMETLYKNWGCSMKPCSRKSS
jgi:hypothetical protein